MLVFALHCALLRFTVTELLDICALGLHNLRVGLRFF